MRRIALLSALLTCALLVPMSGATAVEAPTYVTGATAASPTAGSSVAEGMGVLAASSADSKKQKALDVCSKMKSSRGKLICKGVVWVGGEWVWKLFDGKTCVKREAVTAVNPSTGGVYIKHYTCTKYA